MHRVKQDFFKSAYEKGLVRHWAAVSKEPTN